MLQGDDMGPKVRAGTMAVLALEYYLWEAKGQMTLRAPELHGQTSDLQDPLALAHCSLGPLHGPATQNGIQWRQQRQKKDRKSVV